MWGIFEFVLPSPTLVWSTPLGLPKRCGGHMHAPTFNKWHQQKKKKKTLHMLTHDTMRERGLTSSVVCINDKIYDIREGNVTIKNGIWTTNIRSLGFWDIRKWVAFWGLILQSLGCTWNSQFKISSHSRNDLSVLILWLENGVGRSKFAQKGRSHLLPFVLSGLCGGQLFHYMVAFGSPKKGKLEWKKERKNEKTSAKWDLSPYNCGAIVVGTLDAKAPLMELCLPKNLLPLTHALVSILKFMGHACGVASCFAWHDITMDGVSFDDVSGPLSLDSPRTLGMLSALISLV